MSGTAWACGHRRNAASKALSQCTDEMLRYGVKHGACALYRGMFGEELRDRYLDCPACANQKKRARRHWAALAIVAAVLLAVTCAARADVSCVPYCPKPGESRRRASARSVACWFATALLRRSVMEIVEFLRALAAVMPGPPEGHGLLAAASLVEQLERELAAASANVDHMRGVSSRQIALRVEAQARAARLSRDARR